MRKILIIGGVAGGATAATRLRRLSEEDEIIIFERSGYVSFANCGLPYYFGEVIKDRNRLLQETPETLKGKFNLDVRTYSEVTKIDAKIKKVHIKNLKTNEEYDETFDKLIISTGASPRKINFEGLKDANNVFYLRNIEDVDLIYKKLSEEPQKAVVVGGGFVGVECAENLVHRGLDVTLVETRSHILPTFDEEIVCLLENELRANGIHLLLNKELTKFENNGKNIYLKDGSILESDLTILSIGVVPESKLTVDCGLIVSKDGYIKTNDKMEIFNANDNSINKDIYAIGDVAQINDFISNDATHIALAGPANREARLVADVINGLNDSYKGAIGTSVLKVFSLTGASTGYTETLCEHKNIKYESVIIERNQHAGYYPDASLVTFKLVFDPKTQKILCAQAVGLDGVEKRIDIIATAIKGGLKVQDLTELELSYAPPYGTAKDIVNIAGYASLNLLEGKFKQVSLKNLDTEKKDAILIDSRTPLEYSMEHFDGAINIPFVTLRDNLDKLPKDKNQKMIVYCNVGMTAYMWIRVLVNLVYTNLYNVEGGMRLYKLMHQHDNDHFDSINNNKGNDKVMNDSINYKMIEVDCTGLQCPGPIMEASNAINKLNVGERMKITASDCGFTSDIDLLCKSTGNTLISNENKDGKIVAVIEKGQSIIQKSNVANTNGGTTIVLFSGDMDKALASLIIAQGTRAMGKPATVFCTFWGLNLLRKPKSPKVKKSFIEKMFGIMMPKGAKKFKLSKMNMCGMGSKMMRGVMKNKNVPVLEEQLENAKKAGVRFLACTMSMDIMGIKKEELIDGIEYVGVATYLSECQNASTTLFI